MPKFSRIVLSLALLTVPAVAATGTLAPTVAAAAPAVPPGGPYWSGWDIARAVSITPSGQAAFILDGYGGLHGVGIGGPAPAKPAGLPYWPGWDIARGLAMRDASSGWILDAFGGVHPFGGAPAVASGLPYHSGVDSARGIARAANGGLYVFERGGAVRYGTVVGGSAPPVLAYAPNLVPAVGADIAALSDASGALALDGFGGIHHLGVPSVVPRADGPWWGGWDIGRGIAALPDRSGGFVLDGFGGLHPFTLGNGLPQLHVSTFMGGLANPWDLAFAPDGHVVYTERPRGISVVNGDGSGRHLLLKPADLLVASEAGTMGMAMDPAFAGNRRIYVCYAARNGGTDDVRLVRYQVNNDWSGLSNATPILTGLPINAVGELGRHSGCRPRFGPDGFLWVGTGDSAIGTVPQNLQSLGGKILRIDTNGTAAPGNPVPGGGDARIFSYGHRNVQGIAFPPGNPSWVGISVEHGSDRDDELNRLVGGNFGWDPIPGYNESRPMTDLGKFPTAVSAVWSSGYPTLAPSGATFLAGSRWHAWNGRLATAVLKDKHLRVFQVRSDGSIGTSTSRLTDGIRLRTPVQGPDGFLYVTTDARPGGDLILRIEPN
jgi:glucose/arabinose dehydrogenase